MSGPPPTGAGTVARWFRLTKKELRETLRDRRTIITLVLMPILVYPLLGVAFNKYLLTTLTKPADEPAFRVAVANEAQGNVIASYLDRGERHLRAEREAHRVHVDSLNGKPRQRPWSDDKIMNDPHAPPGRFEVVVANDPIAAVAEGRVHIAIRIPRKYANRRAFRYLDENVRIPFEITHAKDLPSSKRAAVNAEVLLNAVNDNVRVIRLGQRGVPRHIVPVHPVIETVEPTGGSGTFSLGALVPLILILMTITGAVYPAIDLTAGERERGTLEMLVAAPVPRMGVLLGKYAAVVLVAVMTATVNLLSMTLTIYATGLGSQLFGEGGLSVLVVLQVFGLMILFAMFFAALLLALTSFARSFKEAQAYLIPLMLVSIAPGVFSMMPDLELAGLLVVTPLANIVLLARDLFQGDVDPGAAALVVASTVIYALVAILAAARIFGTNAILYGSPGTWSDLFDRPEESSPACTVLTAMMMLAVAFPVCFLMNQFAQLMFLGDLRRQLTGSAVVTILVFGGLPLGIAMARNIELRPAFSLTMPSPPAIAGAVLLGVSLWPFAYELIQLAEQAGMVAINEQLKQRVDELVAELQSLPVAGVLLALAVVPAVFEEWFFRGMLLSSIRERTGEWPSILLSAFAFAAFHVIIQHQLAFERLLPSFLLGVALGWVCLKTGSLWPGVILHVCHNGFLISLIYLKTTLQEWSLDIDDAEHLPGTWLLIAAVVAGAGFILMSKASRQDRDHSH